MTDDWARPADGDRRPPAPSDDVIEITLAGPGGLDAPSRPDDVTLDGDQAEAEPDDEPNWRKIVGISSLIGVALGLVVAVVMLNDDGDDPVDPATTTLAPDEASTLITTPATLPPVDEVDDAFAGQQPPDAGDGSAGGSPLSVPDYPPVLAETWGVAASDFPLLLPGLPIDRPVISLVTISRLGESFGGPAAYDPVTDRFRIELGDDNGQQILLVDLGTEEVLIAFLDDALDEADLRWTRVTEEFLGTPDDFDVRDFITALLLGPLRGDNIGDATSIGGDELVLLDESTAARRRDVVIPAGSVPEWDTLYGSGRRTDGDLEFEIYISQDGATYVTQGVNDTGGEVIRTVHRVRVGDDRVEIGWPSEDLIDDIEGVEPPSEPSPTDVTLDELLPQYPPAEDALAGPPDVELEAAIENLRRRPPAAYTVWERGPRGVYEITIRRDDDNDRLAYTREAVEVRDGAAPFDTYFAQVDDRSSNTGWLRRSPTDSWASGTLGAGIAPIDPRWAIGVLTPDELGTGELVGPAPTPVVLDNGVVVQPFALVVPADTLEWDEPLVGGLATSNPLDVVVYVGADGFVHEIQVIANTGLPRVYQQRFDQAQPAVTIELP
jgi:hypothetical protein